MSVSLTGTEGLFTRMGVEGKEFLRIITAIGSTLGANVELIRDQYESGNEGVALDGIYSTRDSYRTVHSGYLTALQSVMQRTVTEQVNRDVPLLNKTLTAALTELISQMRTNSDSILRGTTSATASYWASNKGNAVVNTSLSNEYGDPLDMVFAENVRFTCTSDTASGATQYQEGFAYTGAPSVPVTDYLWPAGSASSGSLTLFDAAVDGLIKNADFETWTVANTPDNWTISVGAAGTTVLRSTSAVRGTYSLSYVSDGATLVSLKQQLSSSLVKPNKVYALNLWAKINTLDATGSVRFRLTDGAGTTLTNDAGTSQTFSRNVNGQIGTSYTNISTFFQTPRQLPSTGVYLVVEFTTSPTAARTVNFDLLGLAEATQLYAGGPYCKAFSKDTANAVGDYATVAVANSVGTATWVRAGQRFLGLTSLGPKFYLPSVTSAQTVNDALLT